MMKQNNSFIKIAIVLTCVFVGTQVVLASSIFSGSSDENSRKSKYSLSNLNSRFAKRNISIYNLKTGLTFKGNSFFSEPSNNTGTELKSIMQYEKGNITYIMPYKLKVHVPKFKTPSPNQ